MPIATWERRFNVTVSGNRDTTGGTKVVGDGDIAMRNLIPTAIFATFCLMATEGDAKPTRVDTTRASVKQECGNTKGCVKDCGSTTCDYTCTKKGCKVIIFLRGVVRANPGRTHVGAAPN
jgi:hypothetical protein